MREGSTWLHKADILPEEKHRLISRLAGAVWCCTRSMTRHLLSPAEDEAVYVIDCRSTLRPELAEDLISARHRPARALYELSCAINALPFSVWRRIEVDRAANELCDAMGSNERIYATPVPLIYTKFTSRFLEIWLLFLPMTLYDAFSESWNHWAMYVLFCSLVWLYVKCRFNSSQESLTKFLLIQDSCNYCNHIFFYWYSRIRITARRTLWYPVRFRMCNPLLEN
jgi:predicted membrane chloride channel (bestrophin family)